MVCLEATRTPRKTWFAERPLLSARRRAGGPAGFVDLRFGKRVGSIAQWITSSSGSTVMPIQAGELFSRLIEILDALLELHEGARGGRSANVINLSPQPWPGQEIPGLGRAVAAVPSLVLLPSSAHVRPRRQLNGCRFASEGGISRSPGERVPAAVWPAFLRCSSGAACS